MVLPNTAYRVVDAYGSAGLGKISVRSRTKVVTYRISFLYYICTKLYLTIVRQAPTS